MPERRVPTIVVAIASTEDSQGRHVDAAQSRHTDLHARGIGFALALLGGLVAAVLFQAGEGGTTLIGLAVAFVPALTLALLPRRRPLVLPVLGYVFAFILLAWPPLLLLISLVGGTGGDERSGSGFLKRRGHLALVGGASGRRKLRVVPNGARRTRSLGSA